MSSRRGPARPYRTFNQIAKEGVEHQCKPYGGQDAERYEVDVDGKNHGLLWSGHGGDGDKDAWWVAGQSGKYRGTSAFDFGHPQTD